MKRNRTVILPAALLLAVLMTVLLTVGAAADSFADVPADAWYAPAVAWALENGVTTGTSFSTFSPSDTCTRGQVVTFLWRASGRPEPETKACPFADVAPGSYYEKAVLWAVETGITNGTSASEFSPDALCTGAHILTFLWRSLGQPDPGVNGTLPLKDPGAYYAQPWIWAANNDMLRDMDGFDIEGACSRAMMVTWLYRAVPDWDPAVIQRQFIFDEGGVCGVCYAGFAAGAGDRAGLLKLLEERGFTEDYPFLSEIPEENVVITAGGADIYLIIPKSPDAEVTVSRWIIDESNGYKGAEGEVLYRGTHGQPVLLCCNVSDIMPDTVVKVRLSAWEAVIFNPRLSMKNGRLLTTTVPELGDEYAGGKFCDLTPYPSDDTLAAPTVIRWEQDDSMLPYAGGLRAVWEPVPGAEDYIVRYYAAFPPDHTWTLKENETVDDTRAGYFCQDFSWIRLDVCAASEKGIGPVTSVVLTEEELYPILLGRPYEGRE